MISTILGLLKIFSTLSTAIFGFFAIGTDTRKTNGSLTKYGKIAVLGLLLSLIISTLTQYFEYINSLEKQKKETEKLEKIVAAGYYGAFSTADARYTLRYRFDRSIIESVDAEFIKDLDSKLNNYGRGCTENHSSPLSEYECDGYTYRHDPVDFGSIEFNGDSNILKFKNKDRAIRYLFLSLGVSLAIKDRALIWDNAATFPVSGLMKDVVYTYDRNTLNVNLDNRPIPSGYLAERNISSIADLAGKTIIFKNTSFLSGCHKSQLLDYEKCQQIYQLAEKADISEFMIMFPHRRNIMYGSSNFNDLKFTESVSDEGTLEYEYTYPNDVAEFEVSRSNWHGY